MKNTEPQGEQRKAFTDTERIDWMERRHAYIYRAGYRGRDGFHIIEADPGGHYQEEAVRIRGHGMTIRKAIDDAMKDSVAGA